MYRTVHGGEGGLPAVSSMDRQGFDFIANQKIDLLNKPLTELKAANCHWQLSFESSSYCNIKSQTFGLALYVGGEGGIRTPGPLRVICFQDRRTRPDYATSPY